MSYYQSVSGLGKLGYAEGLGASFPTRETSESLRAVQQNLQRMGLLQPGTGARGADGRWGLYTAAALSQANARLGRPRTPAPYVTARGGASVEIRDDLIAAIQAAANAATATVTTPTLDTPPVPGPDPTTSTTTTATTTPLPPVVEETSNMRLYVVGGTVAVVALGAAAYFLWPSKKTVAANRRRARRRRR